MKSLWKLLFALCLVVFSTSVPVIRPPITAQIMEQLVKVVDSLFYTPGSPFNGNNRKYFRFAFHDCMGGCDGSINATNPSNKGLEATALKFTAAYSNPRRSPNTSFVMTYLSRADFFTLVELRALANGIKKANLGFATFNNATPAFNYGRVDNPLGPVRDDTEGTFPKG